MSEPPRLPYDLAKLHDEFDEVAKGVTDPFLNKVNAVPLPDFVYHYTTDVGLKGILGSGKLWFTDVFELNDPSELAHGFSKAVDQVRSRASGRGRSVEFFSSVFAKYAIRGMWETADYFVCCSSMNGDELGQWRAYADNGRGFCIGFDSYALVRSLDDPTFQALSFPVTYDDERLGELQSALADAVIPFLERAEINRVSTELQREYFARLGARFTAHVLSISLAFKHTAYENEREFRLMKLRRSGYAPLQDVKLRSHPYALGRYVEVDWRAASPTALKEIIIGPSANRDQAEGLALDCMWAFELPRVPVKHSTIPYRAT